MNTWKKTEDLVKMKNNIVLKMTFSRIPLSYCYYDKKEDISFTSVDNHSYPTQCSSISIVYHNSYIPFLVKALDPELACT